MTENGLMIVWHSYKGIYPSTRKNDPNTTISLFSPMYRLFFLSFNRRSKYLCMLFLIYEKNVYNSLYLVTVKLFFGALLNECFLLHVILYLGKTFLNLCIINVAFWTTKSKHINILHKRIHQSKMVHFIHFGYAISDWIDVKSYSIDLC